MGKFLAYRRDYTQKGSAVIKRFGELAHSKAPLLRKTVLALSIILLFSTTLYAGLKTSDYFSTNSDALIATQQFSDGVRGNTVALPGDHSNILMVPLLYAQGHLPYHHKSFTAANTALILFTIVAWAVLLVKLFGRAYAVPILLVLSSLEFTSVTFNLSIGNTTFRNIAYPIALAFVMVVGRLINGKRYSRRQLVGLVTVSVLFCLVLAGDSFFN